MPALRYDNATRLKLRKLKAVPAKIKNAVYKGCQDPRGSIQFGSDVSVYNVWEALLYVQGYEGGATPCFAVGTAQAAIDAYEGYKAPIAEVVQ